jgi:hypothetical protein
MARNDQGQGIAAIGCAHGPRRLWFAELAGQGAIGCGCAIGNVLQGAPHGVLKGRALRRQSQAELA